MPYRRCRWCDHERMISMNLRRLMALLLCLLLLPLCALAQETQRVFHLADQPETAQRFSTDVPALEICFPPVKGADACILRMGDEVIVIDAATYGQYPRVGEMIKQLGIEQVKTAFNTHPHDDHIQGFEHLIHDAKVQEFLYTFPEDANNNMKNALRAMKENNVPSRRVSDGYVMMLGGARLEVIQREEKWFSDNNRSAMVKVTYGDCTMLLAADVELDGQNLLLNTTPEILKADILKYPHHGVDKAGWNFLKHVGAELAVITNSRYNVKVTRKDAEKRNLPLIYSYSGPITFKCDGNIWLVKQAEDFEP